VWFIAIGLSTCQLSEWPGAKLYEPESKAQDCPWNMQKKKKKNGVASLKEVGPPSVGMGHTYQPCWLWYTKGDCFHSYLRLGLPAWEIQYTVACETVQRLSPPQAIINRYPTISVHTTTSKDSSLALIADLCSVTLRSKLCMITLLIEGQCCGTDEWAEIHAFMFHLRLLVWATFGQMQRVYV
jgi:hypothetical protein